MIKKYAIYRLENIGETGMPSSYTTLGEFVKHFDTRKEAEEAIKTFHRKRVVYTIIETYRNKTKYDG